MVRRRKKIKKNEKKKKKKKSSLRQWTRIRLSSPRVHSLPYFSFLRSVPTSFLFFSFFSFLFFSHPFQSPNKIRHNVCGNVTHNPIHVSSFLFYFFLYFYYGISFMNFSLSGQVHQKIKYQRVQKKYQL